eukprot:jgi/Botrbrau1/16759/Bobra.0269s0003.4
MERPLEIARSFSQEAEWESAMSIYSDSGGNQSAIEEFELLDAVTPQKTMSRQRASAKCDAYCMDTNSRSVVDSPRDQVHDVHDLGNSDEYFNLNTSTHPANGQTPSTSGVDFGPVAGHGIASHPIQKIKFEMEDGCDLAGNLPVSTLDCQGSQTIPDSDQVHIKMDADGVEASCQSPWQDSQQPPIFPPPDTVDALDTDMEDDFEMGDPEICITEENGEASESRQSFPHGLYQLVKVGKEEQNAAMVPKLHAPRSEYDRLFNHVLPGSSQGQAARIDFKTLNRHLKLKVVGIPGPSELVHEYLISKVPAFPAEVIPLLSEGLYLFLPTIPQTLDGCEALAYLFIWTPGSTFIKATRNSPYCSLYRYMLELASDVVHIFDVSTLEGFEADIRPFGRSQRKQFASFKLVGKTEQETDIFFDSSEPVPLGMDMKQLWQPGVTAVDIQAVKSNCCILAAHPRPSVTKQKEERLCMFLSELKDQIRFLVREHSLEFGRQLWTSFRAVRKLTSLDDNLAAKVIEALDPEMHDKLRRTLHELEERQSKEKECPQDMYREEWAALVGSLELVAANRFPGVWPDTGDLEVAAKSKVTMVEIKQKIVSLEQKHTCPSCCNDFEDCVGQDAVALSCNNRDHFLCRNCFVLQEDEFCCPTCNCRQSKARLASDETFVIDEKERMTLCNLRAELAAFTAEVAKTEQRIETAKVLLSAAGIKTEQYFAELKIAGAANNLLNIEAVEAVIPEEQKEDGQFQKIRALKKQCFDQNKWSLQHKIGEHLSAGLNGRKGKKGWFQKLQQVFKGPDSVGDEKTPTLSRLQAIVADEQRRMLKDPAKQAYAKYRAIGLAIGACRTAYFEQRSSQDCRAAEIEWEAAANQAVQQLQSQCQKEDRLSCILMQIRPANSFASFSSQSYWSYTPRQVSGNTIYLDLKVTTVEDGKVDCTVNNVLPSENSAIEFTWHPAPQCKFQIQPDADVLMVHPIEPIKSILIVMKIGQGAIVYIVHKNRGGGPLTETEMKLKVRRGEPTAASYDADGRFLCLFSRPENQALVYRFDNHFKQLQQTTDPLSFAENRIDAALAILIPGKKEILIQEREGAIRVYDFAFKRYNPTLRVVIPLKGQGGEPVQLLTTPDGSMLVCLEHDPKQGWLLTSYILEAAGVKSTLSIVRGHEPLPPQLQKLSGASKFEICLSGTKTHFVGTDPLNKRLISVVVHVTSHLASNSLSRENQQEQKVVQENPANAVLNFLYHIFDKFPAAPILGDPLSPTVMWLAASTPNGGPSPSAKLASIQKYGENLLEDVKRRTNKPFEAVYISWETLPVWPTAEDLVRMSHNRVTPQPLGAWVTKAICLVPIQICRCENNSLIPLTDGLPQALSTDVKEVEDAAKQISFGAYEAIFQSCPKPLLVVTSMGAQSTGKSYQLNHLGGTLFDGSGGRCTDGCWLSAREAEIGGQAVLMVYLDCEGLGSWERTESEDMLLALVSAAMASLTMFKTHFDFNRYTRSTLERFNQGAPKVKAMCGVTQQALYQGTFMFALNDTQESNAEEVMAEFGHKTEALLQEPDNFLSTMFPNGVIFAAFPFLENPAFYEALGDVRAVLEKFKPQFNNPFHFATMSKTLLAKIAHKDWTLLDRNWIRGRVALLDVNITAACHLGALAGIADSTAADGLSPLQNFDSEALVPDGPLNFTVHISNAEAMVETSDVTISALESRAMDTDPNHDGELVHTHMATVDFPDAGIALGRPVRPLVLKLST